MTGMCRQYTFPELFWLDLLLFEALKPVTLQKPPGSSYCLHVPVFCIRLYHRFPNGLKV